MVGNKTQNHANTHLILNWGEKFIKVTMRGNVYIYEPK